MLRIDVKRKDVGKITPSYHPDEFDRPAHYEWQNKFFDAHGREIVPGQPLVEEASDAVDGAEDEAPAADGKQLAAYLIENANSLPWGQFKADAQSLLGASCPKNKPGILARLQALVEGREVRVVKADDRKNVAINQPVPAPASKPAKQGAKAWPPRPKEVATAPAAASAPASNEAPAEAAAAAKPAPAAPVQAGAIDLAAWGRGEVDYLNGQLTRAAKSQLGIQVTERRDLLEQLVAKGLVTAEGARVDL